MLRGHACCGELGGVDAVVDDLDSLGGNAFVLDQCSFNKVADSGDAVETSEEELIGENSFGFADIGVVSAMFGKKDFG